MDQATLERIRESLGDISQTLRLDGYDLEVVDVDDGTLVANVVAGEDACQDCLVPKDMMASMVLGSLPDDVGVGSVELSYPGSTEH